VLVASLLATSTLLAGCSASSSTESGALSAQEVADRYGYNDATATLSPVFALVPQYKDPKDGYARDLLAAQCLAGVVEYRVVAPDEQTSLIDQRTGQLTFNQQVAAQWGYPQLHMPAGQDSAVPNGVTITPAIQSAMRACGEKADERLGTPPQRVLADIEDAGWQALSNSSEVQDAITQWRSCMEPAGLIDLPSQPSEMPPASVASDSQVQDAQGNLVPKPDAVASDREKEVAVLDAQCRAQVGYDTAVLHARAEAELTAIGQNLEGFEASRGAYEDYEQKLDEVINELG